LAFKPVTPAAFLKPSVDLALHREIRGIGHVDGRPFLDRLRVTWKPAQIQYTTFRRKGAIILPRFKQMRTGPLKSGTTGKTAEVRRSVRQRVAWVLPCLVAFLASFCVMVVELVAGRLVARHLGASLYTWTSVIGVVLTGLAVGHYLGGRIADRYRPARALSTLFILASACCLATLPLNRYVGEWSALGALSWPNRVALHVTLIFLWPAVLLGTVAPVVAKMALDQGRRTGRTVGNVYAWGTVGSIVGTFMTGYWFIATIGSSATVGLVGGVLAILGVGFALHSWISRIWTGTMVLLAMILVSPRPWARALAADLGFREVRLSTILHQTESAYSFIKVAVDHDEPGLRSLTLDALIHSFVFVDDPTRLHYEYERLYAALTHRLVGERRPIRSLLLGGGGYVFPRYIEHVWPGSVIDVAEIDPKVTQVARDWLGLRPDSPIRIHHLDARNYVEDLLRARDGGGSPRFDFIYGDAFNNYTIPFHLTTVEFNRKLRRLLADDGVYMLNVIDLPASGRFLGAVVNTLRKTFAEVLVFSSRTGLLAADPFSRDTFVVVASPSRRDLIAKVRPIDPSSFPGTLLSPDQLAAILRRTGGLVLTDDYAPVENLLTPLFREEQLSEAQRLSDIGLALATKGQFQQAVEYYHKALRLQPDFAEARSHLGWALYQQGEHDRAIEMFHQAIQQAPTLASAHNNLGWAFHEQGRHAEAVAAFNEALRHKPDFALARNNLGLALSALGRIESAVEQYRQAVHIQPSFADAHYNLGVALAQLGRNDEAVVAYGRALGLNPNHARARNNLGWLLHQKGRHAEAEAELRAAIRASPGFLRAMNNLGLVLTAQGKFDEAVSTYAKLLEQEPGHVEACNNLGIALAKQGKGEQAVRWFTEALKFKPDYGAARDNLLAIYLRDGRYADAIALLRSALKHAPNEPGVLSNLAWLLATCPVDALRDGNEALHLARQADELSGGRSARALDGLAAAQAELGRFEQAVTTATRAKELAHRLGHTDLAKAIADRLALYQSRRPFRSSP